MHYTTSCNTQSSAPKDGQNNFPKHVELTGIINKPLLLHLVSCLYYLYQWCTVKQISDNEIYLLIKYIQSVLWRVAKRLSLYIQNARCLRIKPRERAFKQFKSPVLNVLIANIKHRKPSNFPNQPFPFYYQPFHSSTHVERNNPLLVSATQTLLQSNRWLLTPDDAAHCGTRIGNAQPICVTSDTKTTLPVLLTTGRFIFLNGTWFYSRHSASISLRIFKSHRLQHLFHVLVVPNKFQIITDIVINNSLKYISK